MMAPRASARQGVDYARRDAMLGIPRHHAHYVFGVIQSGLTSAIASAIASLPADGPGAFAADRSVRSTIDPSSSIALTRAE